MTMNITPDQFQTAALGWISAVTVVSGAAALLVVKITGEIKAIRDQANRQGARIDSQQQQITTVALNTPPPQASASPGQAPGPGVPTSNGKKK